MTTAKICSIDGCDKPAKGRGWCGAHWWRWRNNGDPLALQPKAVKPEFCCVDGCQNPPTGKKGMCNAHYLRGYRHGDVTFRHRVANGESFEWIKNHTSHDGFDCLIWPFARGTDGRGMMSSKYAGTPQAHRVMCILVHGDPPSDMHEAAHLCGKGGEGCVHPGHLIWATHKENGEHEAWHRANGRGKLWPYPTASAFTKIASPE